MNNNVYLLPAAYPAWGEEAAAAASAAFSSLRP